MTNSITILEHSGQMNPLGKRSALILREFHEVLVKQSAAGATNSTLPAASFNLQPPAFGQQRPSQASSLGTQILSNALPSLPAAATLFSADPTTTKFVSSDTSSTIAPPPPGLLGSESPFLASRM